MLMCKRDNNKRTISIWTFIGLVIAGCVLIGSVGYYSIGVTGAVACVGTFILCAIIGVFIFK